MRHASSVLVRFPREQALARVDLGHEPDGVSRQLQAARLLEARGVPAARLLFPDAAPIDTEVGRLVFWELLEDTGRPPTAIELGRLARQLHDATATDRPPGLRCVDLIAMVPDALQGDDPRLPALRARCVALRRRLDARIHPGAADLVLCHADLHRDNVVVTPEGPKMVDLEHAGLGPRSLELAPMLVMERRYGASPSCLEGFLRSYGADLGPALLASPGLDDLGEAYALLVLAWSYLHRDLSPEMTEEAEVRMEDFLGRPSRPWRLL
ncbi:MAG: aminoglycoside phosphotransferase family protein [Alphaproteobacteria bacterium]|nr:aminoglycoside phosphotransferase family protein [Alphaproteobacteria bacterium]